MTDKPDLIQAAQWVIQCEQAAVTALKKRVDWARFEAIASMITLAGKVVVTGVGKSAIAARKIAATFATTGRAAVFVDPVGLFHGELGILRRGDVVIMVSHSGETDELVRLLDPVWQKGCLISTIVGTADSTLGRLQLALSTGVTDEPYVRIPTASSAAAVAIGDALAIALAVAGGMTGRELAATHPGGSIGKELKEEISQI